MKRLLLLHQGAIGDFLLTLSLIGPFREALDIEHVSTIATSPVARLAAGRSVMDAYISPESIRLHDLYKENESVNDRLAALLGGAEAILNCLSGVGEPVDRAIRRYCTGRVYSIDPRPREETLLDRKHITRQWAADLAGQGGPVIGPVPPQIIHNHSSINKTDGSVIAIHPGSGGQAKCWPTERFLALADRLRPAVIRWLIGPAERERNPLGCDRILNTGDKVVAEESLEPVMDALADADIYIGNDSGMTHLAAALGVPTLAFFGPTDPQVWKPLGGHVHIVSAGRPGEAMTGIEVETVFNVIRSWM